MPDPQPEDVQPADATRLDDGSEPSTVDAPVRWSGSAAVPAPAPKKQWWRRNEAPEAPPPEPEEPDHWATTPAVDPWADQDTPWDSFAHVPPEETPPPMPPTRIERPVTPPPPPPPPAPKPVNRPPVPAPQPPTGAPAARNEPKLSKKERKRLEKQARQQPVNRLAIQTRPPTVQGRPIPAPPPWAARPPARPLPPPPRRKRRWGRRIALLGLIGVVCCCGLPFAWTQSPAGDQYPVTAALPDSFSDLKLRDTEDAGPSGFAGEYRDGRGKRVTVFGETGFRLAPGSDVKSRIEQAAAEYGLTDVQSYDLGEFGAHERCGVGRDGNASVVVCAWADHGSLATVLLTRRSIADSADLVARLREEVLTPG
ncbi:hypothetical protein JIG36_39825 [Actinoplanes sp. LDG1-06]|uniref:Uncharacterized protein n=1 Tax=Paractinoplanes ovalisporus TaxID=2810368 RepID=A0ABS2APA3_9ACTN|nr:hypothetical protein [Actinoplanes ovalisporus]MBM2621671.1 hypothetical protein [Actinoplanes ovalisporus]